MNKLEEPNIDDQLKTVHKVSGEILRECDKYEKEIAGRPDLPKFNREEVLANKGRVADEGKDISVIESYAELNRTKLTDWKETDRLSRKSLGDHVSDALWSGPRGRGEGPEDDEI